MPWKRYKRVVCWVFGVDFCQFGQGLLHRRLFSSWPLKPCTIPLVSRVSNHDTLIRFVVRLIVGKGRGWYLCETNKICLTDVCAWKDLKTKTLKSHINCRLNLYNPFYLTTYDKCLFNVSTTRSAAPTAPSITPGDRWSVSVPAKRRHPSHSSLAKSKLG